MRESVLWAGLWTVLSLFLGAAANGELQHVLACFPHYLALSPSLVYMQQVFAFCNLHDLSWGTKGLDAFPEGRRELQDQRTAFRSGVVALWVLANGLLIKTVSRPGRPETYLLYLVLLFAALQTMKLGFSLLFRAQELWRRCMKRLCPQRAYGAGSARARALELRARNSGVRYFGEDLGTRVLRRASLGSLGVASALSRSTVVELQSRGP